MNQIPLSFLQLIQAETEQNQCISLDIPQQQGILILPQESSKQQQLDILQQFIANIRSSSTPKAPQDTNTFFPADTDCQVTVEERTQLFKFLQA